VGVGVVVGVHVDVSALVDVDLVIDGDGDGDVYDPSNNDTGVVPRCAVRLVAVGSVSLRSGAIGSVSGHR